MKTLRRSLSIALAAHEPRLLQPIHHAGDGARGQPRDLGEPAGRHPSLQIKKIEAFEIGTGNSGHVGNGLPEDHALRRRTPQRFFEFP